MNAPPRYSNTHARSLSGSQHGHDRAGLPSPLPRTSYMQYEEPSPPDTIGSSSYAVDHFEVPSPKRQRLSGPNFGKHGHARGQGHGSGTNLSRPALVSPPDSTAVAPQAAPQAELGRRPSTGGPPTPTAAAPVPTTGKSKRVRTGCLTCRDRHLKCDEGLPDCLNCRKSSRTCNRGIRLNFTEIQCKDPPIIPPTADWSGAFLLLPLSFHYLTVSGLKHKTNCFDRPQSSSRMSPDSSLRSTREGWHGMLHTIDPIQRQQESLRWMYLCSSINRNQHSNNNNNISNSYSTRNSNRHKLWNFRSHIHSTRDTTWAAETLTVR